MGDELTIVTIWERPTLKYPLRLGHTLLEIENSAVQAARVWWCVHDFLQHDGGLTHDCQRYSQADILALLDAPTNAPGCRYRCITILATISARQYGG
jgi:hypothetical protein